MARFYPTSGTYGPGPTVDAAYGPAPGFGPQQNARRSSRNESGFVGRLASAVKKYVDGKAGWGIKAIKDLRAHFDPQPQYPMAGAYGRAPVDYGQRYAPNDHISPQVRQMFDDMTSRINHLECQLQAELQTIWSRLPPKLTSVHDNEMRLPAHAAPHPEPGTEAGRPPPPLPPRPGAHLDAARDRALDTRRSDPIVEQWLEELPARPTEYDAAFREVVPRKPLRQASPAINQWLAKLPARPTEYGSPFEAAADRSDTQAAVRRKPVPQAKDGTHPGQVAVDEHAPYMRTLREAANRARDNIAQAKIAAGLATATEERGDASHLPKP